MCVLIVDVLGYYGNGYFFFVCAVAGHTTGMLKPGSGVLGGWLFVFFGYFFFFAGLFFTLCGLVGEGVGKEKKRRWGRRNGFLKLSWYLLD